MRWAISIACIVFLIYKLLQINSSEVLYKQFQNISAQKYLFLAFAVILLPLNLFCESIKWKMLLKNVVRINFRQSFRAVLWGQTGAFFTPNSLGEFPVRVLNLPSQYRLSAITMGLAGSFAQTVAVSVLGIVAAAFFLTQNNLLNNFNNRNILLLV
ncbi:MAG: lysylphosphatidylglycerol synthase domain-containing protein, partial [Prevotellaceae bacterium]|nr:lysylphosphatidylglycerol synthase domain-containing protein [Prevotellaceae bacterium]